jgi:uncharacterized protein
MFFSVKELELRKIRFQKTFPPGAIQFLEEGLHQRTPLETTGTAELIGSLQEIRIRGSFKGTIECACDRCLEPVAVDLTQHFDLQYRPAESDWDAKPESSLSDEESKIGYYENGGIALEEVIREQVLLSLPMQRVCREDCQGICPVCGQNRNLTDCGCGTKEIDPRWNALREL